jgi:hypothetical protein
MRNVPPLRAGLISVILLSAGCIAPQADAPSLSEAFDAAAEAHDVPRDLLVAIAYSMTRLEDPSPGDHEHGGIRGYGVMDLGAGAPRSGPDLARGAGRVGVSADSAMTDDAANIAVAASELRWKADALASETGVPLVRIDDWVDVVGWYSGSEDGGAQRSFARQVYGWLERGFRAQEPDGSGWITVRGREVSVPMLDLEPASIGTADSTLVDNIVAAASCNYGTSSRGGADIDTIVVHTAQGSYSGVYNWFQDCDAGASAHYVLRSSDGEITQMVAEHDTAWHAGHSSTNARAVGIELEGYVESPERWYTDAAYTGLAALIADIAARQGVSLDRSHVIAHSEVPGCSSGRGGGRSCHTDPGDGFDWDRLMDALGGASSSGSSSSGGGASSGGSSSSGGASSSSGEGDVVGFVRADSIYNAEGAVGGATVRASTGQTATTDSRGYFELIDVAAGVVTLTVSAGGYATATDDADVAAGVDNWNSVALTSSSGGGSTDTGSASSGSGTPAPPSGLDPSDRETVRGDSVTLSWSSTGASSYEVRIYWWDGSDWNTYYTYTTSTASKTFWPTLDETSYAFMVRSVGSSGTSEWTSPSYFYFEG